MTIRRAVPNLVGDDLETAREPEQPHGARSRRFFVRDPDGRVISVAMHL